MSHDNDAQAAHAEPEPEPERVSSDVIAIAVVSARIGQALIAAGLLLALVQLIRFGCTPSVYAALFASLYGACIWLANRDTLFNAGRD